MPPDIKYVESTWTTIPSPPKDINKVNIVNITKIKGYKK